MCWHTSAKIMSLKRIRQEIEDKVISLEALPSFPIYHIILFIKVGISII
jgi:hypothetical protein